jgi:hypothetical protein
MAAGNVDSADLKAIKTGGLIHESVLDKIFDVSRIPLPYTDMVGKTTHKNERYDWVVDKLDAPDLTNAVVDGSDAGAAADASGERVGNHSQTSTRVIAVSHRADDSDRIGAEKEFAYQLTRANQHLRRDIEGISLTDQASVPDDGASTAGKTGALGSWIASNVMTADGTPVEAVGYNHSTGKTTTPAAIETGAALSYGAIKSGIQAVYEEGGDVSVLMARPSVIAAISEFCYSTDVPIASITADQGKSQEKQAAVGAIQVIVTDFGKVKLVSNRLMPAMTDGNDCVYLLDPQYLSTSYLSGIQGYDLAKTGLSNKKMLATDWGVRCHNERSQAMIVGVDSSEAVVA